MKFNHNHHINKRTNRIHCIMPTHFIKMLPVSKSFVYRFYHKFFALFIIVVSVTGCGLEVPVILGLSSIGVGSVIVDRRSASAQFDDELIEVRAAAQIHKEYPQSHINVTSFNRVVLITGETPSSSVRLEIESMVSKLSNVRAVFNQLVVGPVSSGGDRVKDTWITSKVKTAFLVDKSIKGRDIKVVTEAGIVYLMGIVTEAEAHQVREYVSTDISGVKKVVSLFEIAKPSPPSSSSQSKN